MYDNVFADIRTNKILHRIASSADSALYCDDRVLSKKKKKKEESALRLKIEESRVLRHTEAWCT